MLEEDIQVSDSNIEPGNGKGETTTEEWKGLLSLLSYKVVCKTM